MCDVIDVYVIKFSLKYVLEIILRMSVKYTYTRSHSHTTKTHTSV